MYSPVFGHYGCLWVSLWVYPAGTPLMWYPSHAEIRV